MMAAAYDDSKGSRAVSRVMSDNKILRATFIFFWQDSQV